MIVTMFHLPYLFFSLKKRSFRKQIVTIDSTIRHLQLQRTFRNKIRNREVACSCTLETKSMVNGEEKKRKKERTKVDTEMLKRISGAAKHFIIDIL